jgi:EAL domain-containing protein (putative c-di-GMP-specific phosphodiesterase class I)
VEKISTGLGLRAQAELPRWVATQLTGLADTYHIGTGQMVLVPTALREDAAAQWEYVLQRLHESEFVWMDRRLRLLPYLGVAGAEVLEEGLDARMLRASDAAIEARQRGEMRLQRAGILAGAAPQVDRQRALQLSSTVLSRIRAGDIELYFQPFEPLSSRVAHEAVSGEILCRLRDEQGELMLPGQFLGELQADRRMAELDLAVVRHLDDWLRSHQAQLPPLGRLSINIGGQSLASRMFAQELLALLDRFALSPRQLCFEVTETAAITHADESVALFAGLHERGCQISIDDFGVGFQSFERLKQIPVDVIKIDGSFVRDMTRSPRDLEMVRATVMVARAFNAETVAEYVQDAETAEALRVLQVDWGQGYHFALPRALDEVLLRR